MIYAIDFGTSNSLLGAAETKSLHHSPIELDPNAKDPTILRSILFFPTRSECYFGTDAIREYVKHGQSETGGRLIRSIKKFLPMQSFIGTTIGEKQVGLEEIIGTFLGEMRKRANEHFKQDVTSVVLGRPARFSDDESADRLAQDRLEKAARLGGFKDIQFCPEPVAAAYEFKSTLSSEKTVLVADFGGGTSDFTVIKLGPQAFQKSDVLSIGGLSVAGDAFDGLLMRKSIAKHFGSEVQFKVPFGSNILNIPSHLMDKICSPADISVLRRRDTIEFFKNVKQWSLGGTDRAKMDSLFTLINEQMGFDLFEEIERTKKALGQKSNEKFAYHKLDIDIDEPISRPDFQGYTAAAVDKIFAVMDQTIQDAGLSFPQIDLVCATGGTAKIPALAAGLESRFGSTKVLQHNHFHSIVHGLVQVAGDSL